MSSNMFNIQNTVFTSVSLSTFRGEGTPIQLTRGTPFLLKGVPLPSRLGGYHHPSQWEGAPQPFKQGVAPSKVRTGGLLSSKVRTGGYPHPRSGQKGYPGVPPCPGQVPDQDGRVPQQGQHSMYLLCIGRCASCVHAGGLSCSCIWLLKAVEQSIN